MCFWRWSVFLLDQTSFVLALTFRHHGLYAHTHTHAEKTKMPCF